jgi:hypothetical protein
VKNIVAKSVKKLIFWLTGPLLAVRVARNRRRGPRRSAGPQLGTPDQFDRGAGRARTASCSVPVAYWFASLKHAFAVFHSPKSQNGGRNPLEYFHLVCQESGRGRQTGGRRFHNRLRVTPTLILGRPRGRRRGGVCRRRLNRPKKTSS